MAADATGVLTDSPGHAGTVRLEPAIVNDAHSDLAPLSDDKRRRVAVRACIRSGDHAVILQQ